MVRKTHQDPNQESALRDVSRKETVVSDQKFEFVRDEHNRLVTHLGDDISLGIKMLSESDAERTDRGVHAYAVLDLQTSLGPIRIRDLKVVWNEGLQLFQVRWRQWKTGKIRNDRPEWLDVAGPQDKQTRENWKNFVLDVFHAVREGAGQRAVREQPRTTSQLGQSHPELAELRNQLAMEAGE